MNKVLIDAQTPYPIECGQGFVLSRLVEIFSARLSKVQGVVIVSDREVSGYYISDIVRQFELIEVRPVVVIVEAGQGAKSLDAVKQVYEGLVDANFHESDLLFALGGGGVLDVAAFAAATFFHGLDYVQIPTSLLAMIDSSISDKAFLNYQSYKDCVSVTASPVHTMIDTDFLTTLPPRYKANGIAQIIRYGLLGSNDLLSLLQEESVDMEKLIILSLEMKNKLKKELIDNVASDKSIFNLSFGREIGEAIEGHFRFLKYTHGEALALGMLAMHPTSILKDLYELHGLPLTVEGVTQETLLKRLLRSFPTEGEVSFVALEELGKPVLKKVSLSDAAVCFEEYLSVICQ